jgi:hypothetical protein
VDTFPIPLNSDFNFSFFPPPSHIASPPPPPSANQHYFRTGVTNLDSLIGGFVDAILAPGKKPVENFIDEFSEFSTPSLRRVFSEGIRI